MIRLTLASSLVLMLAACGAADETQPPANIAVANQQSAEAGSDTPASSDVATAAFSATVRAADPSLVALYKQLHAAPELSFKEARTSEILASELEGLGFEVTRGIGQAWTIEKAKRDVGEVLDGVGGYGVVGVLRNGEGPTVLVRADMDALPVAERTGKDYASKVIDTTWTGVENGVMHACGHDVHMTTWVGAARELVANKDSWSGTLIMVAQPAEELGLGGPAMIEDGLFTRFPKPDYNIALHVSATEPAGSVVYSSGYALANVDTVDIKVLGRGGHGAYPHTTIDPVLVSAHIVTALQSLVARNVNPQNSAVVTVGSLKAGAKHNIIADEATLLLTVRSYDDETRQTLLDGIARIAKGQAEAFGAPEPEIAIEADYIPATYNDPDLTARAMTAIGNKIGAANVREVAPVMGGEDFAHFSRTEEKIPSVIFWLGAVEREKWARAQGGELPLPSLHSGGFAPDPSPTIATGVDAMSAAVMNLFDAE